MAAEWSNSDNSTTRYRDSGGNRQELRHDTAQRRSRVSAPGAPRNWSMPFNAQYDMWSSHGPQSAQSPAGRPHTEAPGTRPSLAWSKKRKSDEMLETPTQSGDRTHMLANCPTQEHSPQSPVSPQSILQSRVAATPSHNNDKSVISRGGKSSRNLAKRQNVHDSLNSISLSFDHPMEVKKKKTALVTVAPAFDQGDSESQPPYARTRPFARLRRGLHPRSTTPKWFNGQLSRLMSINRLGIKLDLARKLLLRIHDTPSSNDGRHIPLDPRRAKPLTDERTNRPFISNTIRSSKYSAWNFLPRQLLAQFSKLANFYFLVISIMQMIPGLSTTGNYTTVVPLLFFISVSIGKEGYEDLRRHRLDKEENNRRASTLQTDYTLGRAKLSDESTAPDSKKSSRWLALKWQNLQVGDIVKLNRNEAAPADLILLHSDGPNGIAYIETMALDGETNLKPKQCPSITRTQCQDATVLAQCRADFVVEDPNLDLYNFEGRITIGGKTAPLTNNEVIYRGSVLRNTSEAYCLVIYTGEECKIRMNASKNPRVKAPSLQYIVNKIVLFIVIFVVALAAFCTVGYVLWRQSTEVKAWYITRHGDVPLGQIVAGYIIMYNTMIPLSLYVSLEIIKICQMLLLRDVDMYDPVTNTPFEAHTSTINEELGQVSYIFSDKTGTLTENIMRFRKLSVAGMAWLHDTDLKKDKADDACSFTAQTNPVLPLSPVSTISHLKRRQEDEYELQDFPPDSGSHWHSSARPRNPQPELTTFDMIRYVQNNPNTAFSAKAGMFLLSLALCHTCLPERSGVGDEITYQASSPDELALVQAAVDLGFLAWNREVSVLTLKLYPRGSRGEAVFEEYEVLDVIEFSSKRKRMSVIVRFPDGRICIMCKGADSVIMERLRLSELAKQKASEVERRTSQRRSTEAHEALRRRSSQVERRASVMSAAGSIHIAQHDRLAPIRHEVGSWIQEREHDTDLEYDAASPLHSVQLTVGKPVAGLPGDSAINGLIDETLVADEALIMERCFQHVDDFASEGLRTLLFGHRFLSRDEYLSWRKIYHDATTSLVNRQLMIEKAGEVVERQLDLTGATAIEDKLQHGVPETIERLRRANIKLWMLTGDKRETAVNIGHSCRLIKDYSTVTILDADDGDLADKLLQASHNINEGAVAHSVVVVDGATLTVLEADEGLRNMFVDLAVLADSVICCRASPSQKASLVESIRKEVPGSVTLAIGDGANDIAMIQEAHVGIGITGKEGLQAARTSDYAIAQFRFLTKLILVHGRWNYIRTCKYTVGTFWKEMLFYLIQALYQLWNGYTGTSLYEPWSLTMFNTLFTSLPVIFIGVFEKDLQPATLIAVPELYTRGQLCLGFNFTVYLSWMFLASVEAILIYFITYELYAGFTFSTDQTLFAIGDLCFTAAVVLISIKVQVVENHDHSIMAAIAIFLSLGGWFLWNIALGGIYRSNQIYGVRDGFLHRFGQNAAWWLVVAVAVSACVVLEYGIRAVKAAFKPTDVETFQALETDPVMRRRFETSSRLWLEPGWSDATDKVGKRALRESQRTTVVQAMDGSAAHSRKRAPIGREVQEVMVDDGLRESTDIHDMLKRHSAKVKH